MTSIDREMIFDCLHQKCLSGNDWLVMVLEEYVYSLDEARLVELAAYLDEGFEPASEEN